MKINSTNQKSRIDDHLIKGRHGSSWDKSNIAIGDPKFWMSQGQSNDRWVTLNFDAPLIITSFRFETRPVIINLLLCLITLNY